MMHGFTEDKRYGVNIMENGVGGSYIAVAEIYDHDNRAGHFWFGIGHFKTIKGAQKSAIRQFAELGKVIKFEEA